VRSQLIANVRWIEVAGDPLQLVGDRGVAAYLHAARAEATDRLTREDGD
jgi:hypothetical protein